MSRPISNHKPTVDSLQMLNAFRWSIQPYLPLDLKATRLTPETLWQVLGYASVHRTSIEDACTELDRAPSGNRLREVLAAALPERTVLQRRLNTALRAQLPRTFFKGKRRYCLALDVTLIPYHGQPQQDEREVVRAQAKAGTKHFHGYATVCLVHDRQRYVLALRFIQQGEPMVQLVRELLNRVRRLQIRIRRVYLDKEFYSVDVFRTLDRRHLAYVLPIPARPRVSRALFQGRTSHFDHYTLQSQRAGTYTIRVAAVYRQRRSPALRRVVHWFAYAVAGLPPRLTARQVVSLYRQRFGIESSYRQLNQVRARTSSRQPGLRLLLVGLALLLVNLYITFRRVRLASVGTVSPHGPPRRLTLLRLARLLGRGVESSLGVAAVALARPLTGFS